MPLPKEIVDKLVSGELRGANSLDASYLNKLPTLGSDIFPDNLLVWNVSTSGSEQGQKLHSLLDQAGLTKSQRAGVTNLLNSFCKVGENDLTLGDIRALTEEELIKLRGNLAWGANPAIESIRKVKKLFG